MRTRLSGVLVALAIALLVPTAALAADTHGSVTFHGTFNAGNAWCGEDLVVDDMALAGDWNLNINTTLDPAGRAVASLVVRYPNGGLHALWTRSAVRLDPAPTGNDPANGIYAYTAKLAFMDATMNIHFDANTGVFTYEAKNGPHFVCSPDEGLYFDSLKVSGTAGR